MERCDREFSRRAARVPVHGVGLSVDVYTPELLELHGALGQAGLRPEYLEVFKAPGADLARIRRALPATMFAYHAEGVWLIDPEMRWRYPWSEETHRMARHAQVLGAAWINHECASKQFGGYSFGTYLPPLFTRAAAEATAANAALCQQRIDQCAMSAGCGDAPILLLELPPLTYFGLGELSPADFFAQIAQAAPCGFVLDIGHLWTQWRYRERQRYTGLESFADAFLDRFPLHRVIQVHLAGLSSVGRMDDADNPRWIDAHNAPVPKVLWSLLDRVLAHPGLSALKGIALEVDTKAISLIREEFGQLREHVANRRPSRATYRPYRSPGPQSNTSSRTESLADLYRTYAQVVSGQQPLDKSGLEPFCAHLDREGLRQYSTEYLPNELQHWGGDLDDLFPKVSRALNDRGISSDDFVHFWFRHPYPATEAYDFFYIKLDRWTEFIGERAPDLSEETQREAQALRDIHAALNDEAIVAASARAISPAISPTHPELANTSSSPVARARQDGLYPPVARTPTE